MIRIFMVIIVSLLVALGAHLIASVPGEVVITAFGYRMTPGLGLTLLTVIVLMFLAVSVWSVLRRIIGFPAFLSRKAAERKYARGVEALSNAVIAIQTGDPARAKQLAREARLKLGASGAAHLLEAQASLRLGNWQEARTLYRQMISNPDTAVAALSGLYEQAMQQGHAEAALEFADKVRVLAPETDWANQAVFDDLAKNGHFEDALAFLTAMPRTRVQRDRFKRLTGVLQTAIAKQFEESDPDKAVRSAAEGLKQIPDFVPAALIAARIHINRGDVRKASGILRRIWRIRQHPHLAILYANAQTGTSAIERLKRTKSLVDETTANVESRIVLAGAAVDAHEWDLARATLQPIGDDSATQSFCALMAKIEQGQTGDHGRARVWLGKVLAAQPDKCWVADGISSDTWEPVSPLDGKLDRFVWTFPRRVFNKATANPTEHADPANGSSEPEPIGSVRELNPPTAL